MAKENKRVFKPEAGGSVEMKGSADSTIEFVPETNKKSVKEKGTCDTCTHNRYHLKTEEGVKGFCTIGNLLRGTTVIPPENTCDHWTTRRK